ncbi:DUF1254 domain-containing protein [Paraburkholderia pallida]|nr:DUF1254 domain-containing protein [Paraburkholderia pallida]
MLTAISAYAQSTSAGRVPVTVENFARAESDVSFANFVKMGGFGKFAHNRDVAPIDRQPVVRPNRDTLYSVGVFDLDAGPLTITLPQAAHRYMAMQVITEEEYTPEVIYQPGSYTFTRKQIGSRYVVMAVRTLVNPEDPADLEKARHLQDAIVVKQASPGKFEIPDWDPVSQAKVRDALRVLGSTLPDLGGMFGAKGQVDPVRHLIGTASAWGGNPTKDAIYLNVTPEKNDGKTIYHLRAKDVPVDGFWSISVYNAQGFFQKNDLDAYTVNNVTAKRASDGSVDVQFGGCDGKIPNCLPITDGWNYMVRLYRPRAAILDGQWHFPVAVAAN